MRIIIIDDNISIVWLFACFARRAGEHAVTTFCDPKEAVEYLKSSADYDLVVTDYSMHSDITGVDIAMIANKRVPVILISGSVAELNAKQSNEFNAILSKPVSYDCFKETIDKYLPK